jgi:CarD family transcriptional regulator
MGISVAQPEPAGGEAPFDTGDLVVHPHHGAGRVVSRQQRALEGKERSYLEIDLLDSALRIMVPCESAAAVGLRAVVGPRQVRRIVDVLESGPDAAPERWSARERHYREKLKSGDVFELASVVRDLSWRATESGLAAREQMLLERSLSLLASELGCALGVDAAGAHAYIEGHVARGRRTVARPPVGPPAEEPAPEPSIAHE